MFLFVFLVAIGLNTFASTVETSLISSSFTEQIKKVSGVVLDETNAPLAGVLVQVEGTVNGVITDHEGKYVITKLPDNAKLMFSYMGYKPFTVAATKDVINHTMELDALKVDDIVVVGFGSQKKVNLTGSVSTVDSEVFESRPVQNATQALQGTVPGLNISQSAGNLDQKASINIRGMATIGAGSSGGPLILIDGMEGNINTINPQDIESVSVLKDAAASSIYGSRAPFGVILITTKKGKVGKMTVNYNNSFRYSTFVKLPETADSFSFATFFNDALTNNNEGVMFNDERMQRIKDYMSGKSNNTIIPRADNPNLWADGYAEGNDNVDWFDAMYKDWTFAQEHTVSLNGGTEKQQVYASANYLDQNGFMNFGEDKYKRYATNLKATGDIFDFLKYSYNIKFQREDFTRPSSLTNDFNNNIGRQAWSTLPLYDNNGHLYSSPSPALQMRDGGKDTYRKDEIYQQFRLVATPLKGWNITAELNYRLRNELRHWDTQKIYNHDVQGKPVLFGDGTTEVYEYANSSNYMNPNVFTDYSFDIKDAHHFKIMLGFQSEQENVTSFSAKRNGVIVPYMDVIDVTAGLDGKNNVVPPSVTGDRNQWATTGFFGRINYDYKERYLVELNMRYDGTSRYREDKRWNWFPSFSLGWNIAKEAFWEDYTHIMSTFKIRGSYGELGNQNTDYWYPTYASMGVSSANSYWLIGGKRQNTASSPALLNPRMTWESVNTTDIGLDVAFFRNRLTASFDWFNRKTLNMIGPAPELPATLGTAVPTENNTDLNTYGWDLAIKWNDRTRSGFGYSVGFILSDTQTKITSYPNDNNFLDIGNGGGKASRYYSGQKVGEIWGYETIGIAKTQAEMDAHLASLPKGGQSDLGSQWSAGDIMYRDINGDGKIGYGKKTAGADGDTGDMRIIGNSQARYTFGLDLSADYKGFDIRAFFQGCMKRDVMPNNPTFWGVSGGTWWSLALPEHMDYFRDSPTHPMGQNMDSYYPRPLMGVGKNYTSQTGYIQNAAFIRLKNLQLGYTINPSITNKIGVSYLRVYVSGENLWTGTKLASMFDPETIDGGYNGVSYPLQKVISFGFSVNF